MTSNDTLYHANPQILVSDLGDELALMQPNNSKMFSLNSAGRLLWQRLPATLSELSSHLQAEYDITPEIARADAEAVMQNLLQRGLVNAG